MVLLRERADPRHAGLLPIDSHGARAPATLSPALGLHETGAEHLSNVFRDALDVREYPPRFVSLLSRAHETRGQAHAQPIQANCFVSCLNLAGSFWC